MSSRTSSIDLTTPNKRNAARRVLNSLSSRIERQQSQGAGSDTLLTTLLHPLSLPGDTPPHDTTALKQATARLRQQTCVTRRWFIIDPRVGPCTHLCTHTKRTNSTGRLSHCMGPHCHLSGTYSEFQNQLKWY